MEQVMEQNMEQNMEQSMEQSAEVTMPKKRKKLWLIPVCCGVLALVALAAFFLTAPIRRYNKAGELYDQHSYESAAALFDELGDFRDSARRATQSRYRWAQDLTEREQYTQALAVYEQLGAFEDSEEYIRECNYCLGLQAVEAGTLDEAIGYFTRATDAYMDAKDLRLKTVAQRGNELFMAGDFQGAQPYFDQLIAEGSQYYVPHFEMPQEAIAYLKSLTDPVESVSVVVQSMSPYYENMSYWNAAVQQSLGYQFAEVTYDEQTQTVTLVPDYYPGQSILRAHRNGDFSNLTEDEQRTYNKAMKLVEQGRKETADLAELELWLHDWICVNVEYDSPYSYVEPDDYVGLDELTCVGAILDGKANCQGYADAFYLLGNLAGLEVCKVFGTGDGGGHCWNAVRLDGWLYTVDVTFNDSYCQEPEERTYIWYNNALDMNLYTVFGGVSQFEQMVFLEDLSKTYYTANDLYYENIDDAVYALLCAYRENGEGMYEAVVNGTGLDDQDFYDAVNRQMRPAVVYSVKWWLQWQVYKEDTYLTVWFED